MPLSINKLQKFLFKKGLIPKKYFQIQGLCVYIEILCIDTSDVFMLYIPSKYEIHIQHGEDVYELDYVKMEENGNIPDDYAQNPDDIELEKQYDNIDLEFNIDDKKVAMQEKLEEDYNHPLSLKDITTKDIHKLREIFRQLRRFKLCVQSIKYKLCILYKHFVCCIRRDDTLEGFVIQNYMVRNNNLRLMVTIDLENFYTKIDSLSIDLKTVNDGLQAVLDKNQQRHTKSLNKMMEKRDTLLDFSSKILRKKEKYYANIYLLKESLDKLLDSEAELYEKIHSINETYEHNVGIKALHTDIEKSHIISRYKSELDKITNLKEEIINNIIILQTKYQNITLTVDKIWFDNIVMIDSIIKNFSELAQL